jgi:hypothetical protein
MKKTQKLGRALGFFAWILFVPLCNFLYKVFDGIPEVLRAYTFYLRVPLIGIVLILTFALISIRALPFLLRNLFVMSKWYQVSMAVFSTLLVSRSVVVVINAILENAPTRLGTQTVPTIDFPLDYIFSVFLSLPMIWGVISETDRERTEKVNANDREIISRVALFRGVVIGFVSSLVAFIVDKVFLSFLEIFNRQISMMMLAPWQGGRFLDLSKSGYFIRQDNYWILTSGHLAGMSFFLIGLVLFVFAGIYFRPDRKSSIKQLEAPALVYLSTFLAIVVPLLSTMTFALDKFRFPVITTAIGFLALSYWVWQVDYFFELLRDENKDDPGDLEAALIQRLKSQDVDNRKLVVVTASGGGIHASGWTTQVLAGLQEMLGEDFTQSIGLISSVSGGSVGSMFFLAYCEENGCIKQENLTQVVQDSVKDGLGSLGWGLVYQDFAGFVGIPWLT